MMTHPKTPHRPGRHRAQLRDWHVALLASWLAGLHAGACASSGSHEAGRDPARPSPGTTDAGLDPPGGCATEGACASGYFCASNARCLPEGSCATDHDCAGGFSCDPDRRTCVLGTDCGGAELDTTRRPSNVMIVLDRSGTMELVLETRSRWDIAKDAVLAVTARFDDTIRFGLATYSACLPGSCSAGTVVVPVGDASATAIAAFLTPLAGRGSPQGTAPDYLCDSGLDETSTGRTLLALVGEATLQDPTRENVVLLLTDGEESWSCTAGGAENGVAGATRLRAQTVPVRTFAVGFTGDVNEAELAAVAAAGGTGSHYYADGGASLEAALASVAGSAGSCDYTLSTTPSDENKLYVFFDDDPTPIARGSADGWTYDAATRTIHFAGAACDRIRSGAVTDLDVVYGCPAPVVL